ncbi:hypothetical protein PIROE2DRAFT_57707 [Piromyces sp. E2]|nr:hypothetical protein PIROE2DRAFT_57707 [Piromyces sp. E2]|eukprot:OUM69080.1 hypothetical protein PIROE2DRAFT_57707 [Piromyces sp. E2]
MELLKIRRVDELKRYIQENNVQIKHLNNEYYDILKVVVSRKRLQKIINKEKSQILFNKEFYEKAIKNGNYEAVAILFDNDPREKHIILNDFLEIFNQTDNLKMKVLIEITRPHLRIKLDSSFVDELKKLETNKKIQERADINFGEVFIRLYENHLLNNKNIKYIVNSNFNLSAGNPCQIMNYKWLLRKRPRE